MRWLGCSHEIWFVIPGVFSSCSVFFLSKTLQNITWGMCSSVFSKDIRAPLCKVLEIILYVLWRTNFNHLIIVNLLSSLLQHREAMRHGGMLYLDSVSLSMIRKVSPSRKQTQLWCSSLLFLKVLCSLCFKFWTQLLCLFCLVLEWLTVEEVSNKLSVMDRSGNYIYNQFPYLL